jgi:hypothetical protein
MAKSARRNQKKNGSSKRRRVVKGGSGSADWAVAAFGGPGQQHAQAGSNVIAVRDVSAPVVVAGQAGGMLALTPAQAGGMVALTPAVLKGGKKGGALLALSPMQLSEVKNVNDVSNVVKGGSIAELPTDADINLYELVSGVTDAETSETQYFKNQEGQLFVLKPADQEAADKEAVPASEQTTVETVATGGSLLNDIAVPAVLLLGNRMFRGKRRSAKRNPKRRSSRRARR